MASASDSNSVPVKSVGSFTATADPGLGLARVAIFIMRFLGFAGSERALGSEIGGGAEAETTGSGARVIATEGARRGFTGTGTGTGAGLATAGALFFPNNPLTTVTTGSAELGFMSNCSASNVGKLASAPVAFLIGIFEKLFPFGFFGCSACGRGTSDI